MIQICSITDKKKKGDRDKSIQLVFSRNLLQITMATFLPEVMDIESWGEYAAVAHQISTLSKLYPNSYNYYGVSRSFASLLVKGREYVIIRKPKSIKYFLDK